MSNIWTRLQKLTGKKDLRIGTVTEILTDGMSKLEDMYGQPFIAVGQSVTVLSNAYVEDGIIVGEAPALTQYENWIA